VNTREGGSAGPLQKGDDADRSCEDRPETMAAKLPADEHQENEEEIAPQARRQTA
jgi:hypothetical protein